MRSGCFFTAGKVTGGEIVMDDDSEKTLANVKKGLTEANEKEDDEIAREDHAYP
jgi:hypothetical protein